MFKVRDYELASDITEKRINRVLFCTSPLQVVNARSAMDYINSEERCIDYVVIIHPSLPKISKLMINDIAQKMNYDKVIDLTYLVNRSHYSHMSLPKKIFSIKTIIANKINKYQESSNSIATALQEKIGKIDIIFFRTNSQYIDSLFINTQKHAIWFGIEDGFGNYIPKYWPFVSFNKYEMKHKIKSVFSSYSLLLTSIFLTGGWKNNIDIFVKPSANYKSIYSNLGIKKAIDIGDYFKKNIIRLDTKLLSQKKIKVIIIGTLYLDPITHPKLPKFYIDRVVEIYNMIIKLISKKYGIDSSEIWYKPHPRLPYDEWKFKKKNLNCSIYSYQHGTIAEVELLNKDLRAVYSMNSTTLYYAKKIFDLDSYLIDVRDEDCHPSAYKQAYYLAKKFDIATIHI
jgi:hypothetical protein